MAKNLQHQIVARAVELIADKKHWTRGALARKKDRTFSLWSSSEAHSFCAVGALQRAALELTDLSEQSATVLARSVALHVLSVNNRAGVLQTVNDVEGHAAILRM